MHKGLIVVAALGIVACKKTGDNQYEVVRPGLVTDTVATPQVNVGTKTDTVNVPVVGTKRDTIIVDKPVVGTKKATIKTPTVTVKKP
jgi:hypothetical protein